MNGLVALRGLLCIMLAGSSGMLAACKSAPKSPPPPLIIADGMQVTMDMTVTLPDKTVAINSGQKAPLVFVLGKHEVWPSLEIEITGMRPGDRKTFALTADQAAGPYDESKRSTVKLEQLPLGTKVGTKVRSKQSGAEARVVKITGDSAEIDYNDVLAGKDVIVDVTILKVQKP